MAGRAERRREARREGVPFQPEPNPGRPHFPPPVGDLLPVDVARLPTDEWTGGDPILATHPAASDGTVASIADAKLLAHDTLISEADQVGAVRLGPVVWYEWGPADVPAALAFLTEHDHRYGQFPAWFVDHPEGTLVLAAVVVVPPPGVTPNLTPLVAR